MTNEEILASMFRHVRQDERRRVVERLQEYHKVMMKKFSRLNRQGRKRDATTQLHGVWGLNEAIAVVDHMSTGT